MEGEQKKIRVDKRKNVEKVIISKIKNPLKTQREIAKETWLWLWTVSRAVSELEQNGTKDERIITLTEWDFEQQLRIQQIKNQRLDNPEKINNKDLNTREEFAMKRYSVFRGNATGKDWGLNVVSETDFLE